MGLPWLAERASVRSAVPYMWQQIQEHTDCAPRAQNHVTDCQSKWFNTITQGKGPQLGRSIIETFYWFDPQRHDQRWLIIIQNIAQGLLTSFCAICTKITLIGSFLKAKCSDANVSHYFDLHT